MGVEGGGGGGKAVIVHRYMNKYSLTGDLLLLRSQIHLWGSPFCFCEGFFCAYVTVC